MPHVIHTRSGAMLASLAAGPLFVAAVAIGAMANGDPIAIEPWLASGAAVAIIPLVLVGWALAIVPNLIGATAMGWLGTGNIGARLPATWALVGGALGGLPTLAAWGGHDQIGAASVMAAVGAASALLCRAHVRWEDAGG